MPIPAPNQERLRISTKAIPLPPEVSYDQHDEFDVTLRCRIEKVQNEAPLDEHGNLSFSRNTAYAKVLSYVNDDFDHSVIELEADPEDDDDNGSAGE
jgi:hypothetical protein